MRWQRCLRAFHHGLSLRGGTLRAIALGLALGIGPATAADLPSITEARQVNERTIGIVFHYEDIYRLLVNDMANVLAQPDDDQSAPVRVVPMLGKNHVQTVLDMLYMRGVDLGIVHSDVFEYMARSEGNVRVYQRISSLVELFSEKIAIIAGEQYETLEDLAGQKVNFRTPGKGSDVTGTILFGTLDMEVEITRFDKLEALEKVKSGEIAATIYMIEEPIEEFQALSPEDEVHLIELPQTDQLLSYYRPSELTQDDFPSLVQDEPVASLAVPVIIAAYNWPASETYRYGKSRRFIEAFMASLPRLREGDRGDIWQNVSLERSVPSMPRLPLVDTLLAEREAEQERLAAESAAARAEQLRQRQEVLTEQLASRLEDRISEASEPAELDALLKELQALLEKMER